MNHNSLAPNTRRNYDKIVKTYESFCQKYCYTPYSSVFETLSHWIVQILSSVKPATAKSYLSALKFFHMQTERSTIAFKDERLDLIIRGGKRIYGEGAKAIRYPITFDILLRMVNEIGDIEEGINVKAALCVGFAAFLRSGKLTWNTWSSDFHCFQLSQKHVVFHPVWGISNNRV